MPRLNVRDVSLVVVFLCAYVSLDWLSYLQPLASAGITPWNPPPGLSVALLATRGWAYAPAVFAAALASDLLVRGATTTVEHAVASSLWITAGYSGLAVVIRRKLASGSDFRRVMDISWFAGATSPAVLAVGVGFVASLSVLGPPNPLPFPRQVLQFWVGDVIGILVFTPALLVHRQAVIRRVAPSAESIGQVLATGAALWIVWGIDADLAPRLFYVLFLPLIWISVRRGIEGASIALVLIQFGLIAGLRITGREEMVLELQLLMLTLVLTGLLLGSSVSERALVERALRERQAALDKSLRLAAASETASALAHELNQPLAAVANYVAASRAMLENVDQHRARLADALSAAAREATRAGDVTRRMREFFQSGAIRLERTDVEALIRDSIRSMSEVLAANRVTLRIECDPALAEAMVDRIQIESVIHQLVQNAIDAMVSASSDPREITVTAVRIGDRVSVSVEDSGPGIAAELSGTILSPFVTTKPHGMGMGLSICRTIIEHHEGEFIVKSGISGASISFILPSRMTEERP